MKRTISILAVILVTNLFFQQETAAQSPEKISYQAVIRDALGNLMLSQSVGMRVSILQTSANGSAVYVEKHTSTTNTNGLISIEIGGGTLVSGNFSTIDWPNGPYFIKTETDPAGGTNYTISSTSQLLSVPYALHAKSAESISGSIYSFGDFSQGGIVFWLDETGRHGLVCAKTDQSTGCLWFSNPSVFHQTIAYGDGPFSGEMNTSIIIAVQGFGSGILYAARVAAEYISTEGGKSYGDWYMPSIGELNLLYANRAVIDETALVNGGSTFAEYYYWSSTEYDTFQAYFQLFITGQTTYDGKNNFYRVRAVRAF